ncbi:DsrE family protein [Psychroflexus halocasei]|uniref:DsrE/DsrF-like family protein n=1 Tax=Psychroflexus halocasei TaxID=908615 RepID=A0A1H3ZPQ6_9FLAO|nr:DsrE family protein [Psychroflexus halocasei]SEA25687.1 DsrE/DsrF-like family protein [Psychroflexus halocasei]
MKHLILITFAFFSFLGTQNLLAQKTSHLPHNEKENYVVLTRKVPQLKPIIYAAKDLATQDGNTFGEFHVVICGKTILETKDHEQMKSYLDLAKNYNVKIFACGFSMKKFGVKASELPQEMEIVENGILYNFQLQKKGFKSITL